MGGKLDPGALAGATGAQDITGGDSPENNKAGAPKASNQWAAQARWKARNKLAVWAHAATRSAVKKGLIEKRPCAVCGEPDAEAHHPDYRDPLRPEWLCRRHHKALHATERRGAQ